MERWALLKGHTGGWRVVGGRVLRLLALVEKKVAFSEALGFFY